jgi:hypothetical protein
MNSWNAAVVRTARALASLLTEPTGPVDLDVAVTARAAVLDHVSTVLADVRPHTLARDAGPHRLPVPITLIESDPLERLDRTLRGRARPQLDRAPSELLDVARPTDPSTAHWIDAGRYAVVATRDWCTPGLGALDGSRAWQVVAEVAALAEAIAVLDRDLHIRAIARPELQRVIESSSGLRVAARELVSIATMGENSPPPKAQHDATAMKAALAARSRTAPTISTDVRRLTHLLAETSVLTPHHVRACARVGRNLAILAAADPINRTGCDLREDLGAVARGLHSAAIGDRGEFALNPIELRAFELQLRHVHASTKLALVAGAGLGPEESTRLARRIPVLVEVLTQKANAEISGARWALRDRREGVRFPYALASVDDEVHRPGVMNGLEDAAGAAAALTVKLTPPHIGSGLASTLARINSRPSATRPAHQGHSRRTARPRDAGLGMSKG